MLIWMGEGGWNAKLFLTVACAALPPALSFVCTAMFAMQAPPKLMPAEAATTSAEAPQQPTVQPSVAQAAAKPADTATAATAAAGTAEGGTAASAAAASAAAPAAAKPVVVLLDVNLEAPVLLMPLSSGSDDLMEVDLGTLQLKNLVVWEMRAEDSDRQKLLVDEMQVGLSWCFCLVHCSGKLPCNASGLFQLHLHGRFLKHSQSMSFATPC